MPRPVTFSANAYARYSEAAMLTHARANTRTRRPVPWLAYVSLGAALGVMAALFI
jgi:hypothetical protein